MSDHTGIAIVWPAWYLGSTDPELHATALFLGSTEDTTIDRRDIEHVLRWEGLHPGPIRVTGRALFGQERNVPVLTLASDGLIVEQEWLTENLAEYGIVSPSKFEFSPHVTISKEVARWYFPNFIQLERPVLWWGNERPLHSKHLRTKGQDA